MAEIKSTLDIIMERTKNLTMSDDEKASFRCKEAERKVMGWIQKYQNGTIGLDKLKLDIEKEAAEHPEILHILKTQLLDCLRLTGDNDIVLRLLEGIIGISAESIEKIIQSFKRQIDILRTRSIEGLGEELKKRKIYGSAVVPNPNNGVDWQKNVLEAESDLRKQLKSLVK
ncbi:MAG: hypothetical protein ACXWMC_12220 [Syntrophales bacterium]